MADPRAVDPKTMIVGPGSDTLTTPGDVAGGVVAAPQVPTGAPPRPLGDVNLVLMRHLETGNLTWCESIDAREAIERHPTEFEVAYWPETLLSPPRADPQRTGSQMRGPKSQIGLADGGPIAAAQAQAHNRAARRR